MNDISLILAVEERRRAALVAVDMEALDALFAEDLVHVHATALVHDKAGILAHIAARRQFAAIDRGPLEVRVRGDMAVMTGSMANHIHGASGEVVMRGFVTQVLRREGGAWRFVSFQFTTGEG